MTRLSSESLERPGPTTGDLHHTTLRNRNISQGGGYAAQLDAPLARDARPLLSICLRHGFIRRGRRS